MATTLTALREGLAANLVALNGIQVSPYLLANPSPPTIHLYPADIEYDLTFHRGVDKWMFTVQAFVGFAADRGAQVMLDQFIAASGSQSVKQVIEADQTLGGAASSVQAQTCSGYRIYARDSGGPVLGAEWRVEIYATGQ